MRDTNSIRKKVFLSSTYKDLVDSRKAVIEVVQKMDGYEVIGMEQYGARNASPLEYCLEMVRSCDILVCLVGYRHGSQVPGSKKSFTQVEYEEAKSLGKACLVFFYEGLADPSRVEGKRAQKLQSAFRDKLRSELLGAVYRKTEDLGSLVAAALSNLKVRERLQVGEQTVLLFPFVTSITGFNTGLSISNVGAGPGALTLRSGIVSLYFYGTSASARSQSDPLVRVQRTSLALPPGQTGTTNLLYGGPELGLDPVAGFLGFVYAVCEFPNARGYAYISDPSNLVFSNGYLAEVVSRLPG